MSVRMCLFEVPIVALAVVLFDIERDSEGVEVAVRWSRQGRVPDVRWPG